MNRRDFLCGLLVTVAAPELPVASVDVFDIYPELVSLDWKARLFCNLQREPPLLKTLEKRGMV